MTLFELILLLLVAGLCGGLGQALVGYSRSGCLASVALGFIGALLGTWVARLMHLPLLFTLRIGGQPFPIIWSVFGAALFVAFLRLLSGGGRR